MLYVDDFKLAGPITSMDEGWRLLRLHLSTEKAAPVGLYLGCHHEVTQPPGLTHPVTLMTYNMEDFLDSCVKRYEEFPGGNARLRAVNTPAVPP